MPRELHVRAAGATHYSSCRDEFWKNDFEFPNHILHFIFLRLLWRLAYYLAIGLFFRRLGCIVIFPFLVRAFRLVLLVHVHIGMPFSIFERMPQSNETEPHLRYFCLDQQIIEGVPFQRVSFQNPRGNGLIYRELDMFDSMSDELSK